uniref:F-box domain-containing protein n=1 Tax=Steinernema glaseri TaxID=37863 RepID=A0A1I8AB42_9BILA
MDAVPLKFVDSVVELFGRETLDELAQEVRHPLWKDVVDLHHNNRVYYEIYFRMEEGGFKHVFRNGAEGRFTRIVGVSDSPADRIWDEVEPLGEGETSKLLETISPLIDPVACNLNSKDSPDCTRVLMTSLFKRVYLQRITVLFCGQIAYDFLEDQINNSPFLSDVEISGHNWPQSTLDLLAKFCSTGSPMKRHLFDLWKANGNLQFELYSSGSVADEGGLRALMSKGQSYTKGISSRIPQVLDV